MMDTWNQFKVLTTVCPERGQSLRTPQLARKYATSDGFYLVVDGPAYRQKIISEALMGLTESTMAV
eukprot:8481128-Prorocentrum_lima.AAC.1